MPETQPVYLDQDDRKAIVGCQDGTVSYILFDKQAKAQESQQFPSAISKVMFSRDSKKFALCDPTADLVSQFDRDHWL